MKRAAPAPRIDHLVVLLHHFPDRGYGLEDPVHPQRLGRKHPKELLEALWQSGLYNYDQAKRFLLAPRQQRRRRPTPPAPPPAPPHLL
jgi:hypothetical protein